MDECVSERLGRDAGGSLAVNQVQYGLCSAKRAELSPATWLSSAPSSGTLDGAGTPDGSGLTTPPPQGPLVTSV